MNTFTVPPGYKFRPTSQIILITHLKPIVFGDLENLLTSNNNIREADIYSCHPSELFQDLQHNDDEYKIERYFYTTLKKVSDKDGKNGRNYLRNIEKIGKWHGEYTKTILDDHGEVIGYDKYFKFVSETKDDNKTEEWNMHEYSLKQELIPEYIDEKKKNLVVCKIVKIVKANRIVKNKNRVLIRLRCAQAQPCSCHGSSNNNNDVIMIANYAEQQQQQQQQQPSDHDQIIVNHSEDSTIVGSNVVNNGSDMNMMTNYVFIDQQEEELSWKNQQSSDHIIVNNLEDNTIVGSNVVNGSDMNMMTDYVFIDQQDEEPSWNKQQPSDQIIINNLEDNTIVGSSNVNGCNLNMMTDYVVIAEQEDEEVSWKNQQQSQSDQIIILNNLEDVNGSNVRIDQLFDYEVQCRKVRKEGDIFVHSLLITEEEQDDLIREYQQTQHAGE
ncbi:NAC domain-containing protein 72-like [Beta vulgaris subsp. vulgaris]|uniref:NAC domain-containing protein 72-like n=1 Tax=Beta vulgaris subsp. vulgaris TaxID=3555 RepID=UPI0025468102|nr:NAC domain-containing protein 72-like [Beta vulgaris subsp. vulgaris]